MTTLLYSHPACLEHDPGSHHPESPERLRAVLAALSAAEFAGLDRREAPRAAIPSSGHAGLDADTIVSPGSGEAALRAAGAVCAAVDAVMAGEADNAFCAVRPPGHHAEPYRPMGFCLFNSIAIAALRARDFHDCARVAVIDFDVHHGNGTQAMFESDATLFYASTHQSPLYPGTGARSETGVGNIVNVPLAPNSGTVPFQRAFNESILPALEDFGPDFLLVSAGFDAHRRDPLAQLDLTEADYGWVTQLLARCAARHCKGRLVSVLEGGYDLGALGASAAAHVRA